MGASTNVAPVIIKRKKVIAGGGHHGGAWKVAYADFVTAMMAFFLLMWLLSATTEKQKKGLADYFSPQIPIHRVSGGGAGMFGGDSAFSEDVLPLDGRGASNRHPTEERKSRGDSGVDQNGADADQFTSIEEALKGKSGESLVAPEVLKHVLTRVTDEGLVIDVFSTKEYPLFEKGSDRPTPLLRELARMIARVSRLVVNSVALEGHVRAHPVVLLDNPVWSLSAARATRMRLLLEQSGLSSERMQRVTGHADREPVVTNTMAIRNNRIEVILLRQ
ncbi:MAG: chemotaxis protein MotB [Rhodobacteraceae bacterium]|nr:chemotaxis protein MotB [Paracoccaceae bacterium]